MTSVLIAIGVNLFSTGIVELIGLKNRAIILIIFGLVTCIGVIIRIAYSKVKELNQTTEIKGFVIYDEANRELIKVPEYKISTDMVDYLQSAFSENKALEKLWQQDCINQFKIVGGKPGERAIGISTHSGAIFIELLEYCVIEKLSMHLSSYFNNYYEKPKVREFQKSDVPEVLLKNRFLRLFSEEMLNRAAFTCDNSLWDDDKEPGKRIVYARNSNGAIYKRFDLILPENSKITRKNKNEVVIETPILILTISCLFGAFGTVLKPGFYKYYLNITSPQRDYHDYEFNVEVTVKFKIRSLFSKEKEIYYAWVDSFLDELSSYISKDEFFEKINWDVVYSIIRCNNNINALTNSAVQEQPKN